MKNYFSSMRKIILMTVFFMSLTSVLVSQVNIKFNYIPKGRDFKDTSSVTKFDLKYAFSSDRILYKDSSFSDSKLFCIKDTSYCSFYFKKGKNNNWFIKVGEKWKQLYNSKENKLFTIKDQSRDFILKPQKTNVINGVTIFSFRTESIEYKTVCGMALYWFSPDYGVIAVENTNLLLVREDFSKSLK